MKRHLLPAGAVHRARSLRRSSTEAERMLWRGLREAFPAARFRRQVPLGPYCADFASHGAKLVVELDGSGHADPKKQEHDLERTRFLNGEGYRVLRFWNSDVLENLDGVLAAIASTIPSPLVGEGGSKSRMRGARRSRAPAIRPAPPPQPSPQGGGRNGQPPVGVR